LENELCFYCCNASYYNYFLNVLSCITATPRLLSPKSTTSGSTPATYTGSPGRPTNHTSLAVTSTAIYDNNTVIHSGENLTLIKPSDSDDLNNVTSSSNSSESSYDIICFTNSTHHKLRHDKHGGRHRSRDAHPLDIICKNVTVNSTRTTAVHYSNDELLSVVSNITTTTESKSGQNINSTIYYSVQTTTPQGNGLLGDKEYQEGVSVNEYVHRRYHEEYVVHLYSQGSQVEQLCYLHDMYICTWYIYLTEQYVHLLQMKCKLRIKVLNL
jgi:hypothetical protein